MEAELAPGQADSSAYVRFEASSPTGSVLNEVRVRCIRFELQGGAASIVPAFTVWGSATATDDARDSDDWVTICSSPGYMHEENMEQRLFALSNVPRRHEVDAALQEAFFAALPDEELWAALDFHGDDDLTLSLARTAVAKRTKLKSFLARAGGADGPLRLKQWPGKDAVQALATWWMAATLVEGHRYTEPELYAVVGSLCAMQPDHAVMRKDMVRRGYLHPPEIETNADQTTSTYYRPAAEGLRAALRGEWRTKGVF